MPFAFGEFWSAAVLIAQDLHALEYCIEVKSNTYTGASREPQDNSSPNPLLAPWTQPLQSTTSNGKGYSASLDGPKTCKKNVLQVLFLVQVHIYQQLVPNFLISFVLA